MCVGHVQAAVRADSDAPGREECGLGGRSAIAAETLYPVPGHGSDDPVRPYPADAVVAEVSDIHAAVRGHGDPLWRQE